jgi:hypothetical protein
MDQILAALGHQQSGNDHCLILVSFREAIVGHLGPLNHPKWALNEPKLTKI